jgi:type IV pilus assembly protein PilV
MDADYQSKQYGFSMVEILVTILIISLAVLGSAGLQVQALKTNQGGQFRNQAVFLLNDMVERMKANKAYSVSSTTGYGDTTSSAGMTTDCYAAPCAAGALAAYDIAKWQAAILAVLPQGTGSVTQTVTGNPSSYRVTINWVDRKTNTKYATAGAALPTEAVSITTNIQIAN